MSGAIRHRDSVGSDVVVLPGQLDLMTVGRGVSHSELSTGDDELHAVQLWAALPDGAAQGPAAFHQVMDLPRWVVPGPLLHLGTGRAAISVRSDVPARLLLLGGAPFEHDVVMWWNFVGRTHAEVAQARADWESTRSAERFGVVDGHGGDRIPAPELPNVRLRPRRRRLG